MTITIGLLLSACNKVMDLGEDDPSAVTAAIYPKPGSYKTVIPVETALVEIPIHVSDGVVVERLEVNGGSCANAALEATKDGFVIRHSTAMGDTQPKEIDFTIVTSLNGKEYSYTYSYEVSVNTVTAHDVDILNNQNFGTSGILQLTGSDAASVELLSVRQTPKPLSTVCAANPIKIKNGGIWVDADFSGVCTTQYVLHVRKDGICQTITTPSRDFTVAPLVDIDVAPADLSFDIFTNKIVSYTGTDSALGALIYDNVTVSGCSAVNKTVSGNAITFGSDFSAGYSAAPCTANISFDVRSTSPLRLNTHKEFTFNITRKPVELQIPASADVFYKLPNGSHDISYTLLPTNATLSGAGQAPYTYDLLIGATGQVSASHFASGQKITVQNSDIYTHNKTQTIPYTFRAVYNSTTYNLPGTLTINYKYDPATVFELENNPNPFLSNLSDSHTFNLTNVG